MHSSHPLGARPVFSRAPNVATQHLQPAADGNGRTRVSAAASTGLARERDRPTSPRTDAFQPIASRGGPSTFSRRAPGPSLGASRVRVGNAEIRSLAGNLSPQSA